MLKKLNLKNIKLLKNLNFKKLIIWLIILMLLAIGYGAAYYFYNRFETLKNNPEAIAEKETAKIIATVGKLIELPKDETPTIATVLKKEDLKDQIFFQNAENGDQVLAFSKAMKAILYRPSNNKIIEVAPLVLNPDNNAQKLKIAIYNGSKIAGVTNTMEQTLAGYPDLNIVDKINASNNNYAKTIVIDISGNNASSATQLAEIIGGSVETLPDGESKPNADLLIIIGNN